MSAFMGGRGTGTTPRGAEPSFGGSFRGAHRPSVVMRAMVADEQQAFSELHHLEEEARQKQLDAILKKKRQSHAKHHHGGSHGKHKHKPRATAIAPTGSDAYIDLEAAEAASPGPSSRRGGSRRGIVMGLGDAQRKKLAASKPHKKKTTKKHGKKGAKKSHHKKAKGKKRKKHGSGL